MRATPNEVCSGGCSSVGRAPDCDSGCRGFKPRQSPHFSPFVPVLSPVRFLNLNLLIYPTLPNTLLDQILISLLFTIAQ